MLSGPLDLNWLVGLLVCSLATWQAVEIWHHGSLFEEARAAIENWLTLPSTIELKAALVVEFKRWLAGLLLCPFCLSVWVGAGMAGSVLLGTALGGAGRLVLLAVPLALATSRLANLANDLTHGIGRTPNRTH